MPATRSTTVYALIITAIVIHMALLFVAYDRTGKVDGFAFNSLDSKEYFQIASNLVDHGEFSQSAELSFKPDTWRTPGYPLFLAALMLLVGKSALALVVVQQILSIFNVWLFYRITQYLMTTRRGLVASLFFLFEPYHLYYSLWLMATTLFVTLLLLTWLVWLRYQHQRKKPTYLSNGILLGLLCAATVLVRPVAILIPVALLMGMLTQLVRQPRVTQHFDKSILTPVVYMMVFFVVISGWMIRNKRVAGRFALSDQGGVVLAYFKATEAVMWREGTASKRYVQTSLDPSKRDEPHYVWEEIDYRLQNRLTGLSDKQRDEIHWFKLAQGNKTSLNSFVLSDELERIGWSLIFETPVSSIACGLLRCGAILTFPLNIAIWPPEGIEIHRFRSMGLGMVYLFLAVGAGYRLIRHGGNLAGIYFPLACTIALLVLTTPQIDPRFRVPMIPMLIVLAMMPIREGKVITNKTS